MSTMMMMTVVPLGHGSIPDDQSPKAVEKWFKKLLHAEEKLTKLRFYCHDKIYRNNPTAVQVAKAPANITSNSRTLFGLVMVVDNPLTVKPEPDSKTIGFAQGIYSSASREEESLLTILNFAFTDGRFKGSTLSVLGNNPIFHQHRELPIVGGSGVFRLARGSATAETYTFDRITGDPIVE